MNVLGINCAGHDSSVALIQDGRLVFAAEEERFTRRKHDNRFPKESLRAALRYANIEFAQLDAVAFGHEHAPAHGLQDLKALITGKVAPSLMNLAAPFLVTAYQLYMGNGRRPMQDAFGSLSHLRIMDVNHHDAHAWSAYGLSGFAESLIVVVDGRGGTQSTSLYHARGDSIRRVESYDYPNSLGLLYAAFTTQLGFEPFSDEWKVMGLAAYGTPTHDLHGAIRTSPDGYQVNARLFAGLNVLSPGRSRLPRMRALYGPPGNADALTRADQDLAASIQQVTEQAMADLVAEGVRLTGCRNLCLAGGVAMNSKTNGKIAASGLVDEVFVQPAATDDGTAIGAAIAAHAALGAGIPRYRMEEVYWGPEFSEGDAMDALHTFKLPSHVTPDLEAVVASELAQGKIIGWFQGRMEFGPRALGNRSILADPRRAEMKDLVNDSIKFRESWRPFAPSCLAEAASDYFEGCREAPYMIVTYEVKPEKRGVIPAVTHVDNSARVQTVTRSANPRYYRLIEAFGRQTGVPVIMNTSFNLKGEPIVCTPQDALKTFYSSGLDFLVLGDRIVPKDPSWRLPEPD